MERAKLIVKNFGPLKDIEIEVRPMVTLIGAQASGKSTLAKLISIFEDDKFRTEKEKSFEEELKAYNIFNFLNEQTYIEYSSSKSSSAFFIFRYSDKKFKKQTPEYLLNLLNGLKVDSNYKSIENNFIKSFKEIISSELNIATYIYKEKDYINLFPSENRRKKNLKEFLAKKINFEKFDIDDVEKLLEFNNSTLIEKEKKLRDYLELYEKLIVNFPILYSHDSLYISSERNLLHLIEGNTMGLIKNNIQIPIHLLNLGLEYEKAIQNIDKLPLNIIDKNLIYKRENKNSYIYHNKFEKVNLLESASGLQSLIPILLLVEYSKIFKTKANFNFVIEEPELNLYPKAQHELVKYLVKSCLVGTKNLVLTTHSPFVLASVNNLLLAFDKGTDKPDEADKIIKKESWLNPKDFIAYELKNGKARKIMDDKLGQIKDNMIDNVSDFFADEFDKLLDL